MSLGRILFADNDLDFLKTRAEFLQKQGYDVLRAHTAAEAEQSLRDEWVHLAILDIRLVNDDDERDASGLILAKNKTYRAVPKIMLTGFPSYAYVRQALGRALDGLSPAVDFLAKRDGPEAMIQAVEEAFAERIRINWDLTIQWGTGLSGLQLANVIEPDLDSSRLLNQSNELEDLFRRLFYDSRQITFSRLLAQGEGRVALIVFAFSAEGIESQFVVTCGQRDHIQAEEANYEAFVTKITGPGGTLKANSVETTHFAATAYMLGGGNLEELATLTEFYRENSSKMVITALAHLFDTTLLPWQGKGQFLEKDKTLYESISAGPGLSEAALSPTTLAEQIEAICQESLIAGLARFDYSPYELRFYLSDGSTVAYPNPVAFLSKKHLISEAPLLCGLTHGHLRGDTVLVNPQGQTWLIDFSNTGQAPLLRDFISLEAAIKFEMLTTSDMQMRYTMEQHLTTCTHLNEKLEIEILSPDIQKALQVISRIRGQASKVIGDELRAYLGGLLFYTLGYLVTYDLTVRHTRHELAPHLHSLLSAAMLVQQLAPTPAEDLPLQARDSLWLDEANREVWVEGRQVSLSPQEFDLLLYLYHQQGQLCSRTMIAEEVFAVEFKADLSEAEKKSIEEGRINSTMSRLRRKLEPNPDHPRYIISVRGEGYKLVLKGEDLR
jgi:DNA-binding response OmpR family regulator